MESGSITFVTIRNSGRGQRTYGRRVVASQKQSLYDRSRNAALSQPFSCLQQRRLFSRKLCNKITVCALPLTSVATHICMYIRTYTMCVHISMRINVSRHIKNRKDSVGLYVRLGYVCRVFNRAEGMSIGWKQIVRLPMEPIKVIILTPWEEKGERERPKWGMKPITCHLSALHDS